jgi:uncharacterized membrane protein YkgB
MMTTTTTLRRTPGALDQLRQWRAQPGSWTGYFAILNALYLLWLGCLKFNAAEQADVLKWWNASILWQRLYDVLPAFPSGQAVPMFAAGIELLAAACLFGYRSRRALRVGAALACAVYAFNLLYLVTNPVWVAAMGGFPFLGSGQGCIKYVPMLATAWYLLVQNTRHQGPGERIAVRVGWLGIVMVMAWIGSMKFFLFEAQGIEPLLRHHWVFGWMYRLWDTQGVSNVIGLVELVFALFIVLGAIWPALLSFGLIGIAVTVACTTSFMFTLPGWAPTAQFPVLNGAGVFLLKDQFLLAAMLLVWSLRPGPRPAACLPIERAKSHPKGVN